MEENKAITMYGTRWCGDCKRARRLLDDNKIDYTFIDIDLDEDGEKYVKSVNRGNRSVPTIIFPDGSILTEPGNFVLTEKLKEMGKLL